MEELLDMLESAMNNAVQLQGLDSIENVGEEILFHYEGENWSLKLERF
jgi:hypothetical protein